MRITNTGNVGIGIVDPGVFKLNVNGNVNISGSITTNNTLTISGALSTTNGNITTGTGNTTTAFLTSTGGIQTSAINATGGITTTAIIASVRLGVGVASVTTGCLFEVGQGTGGTVTQISMRYFNINNTTTWFGTIAGTISMKVTGDVWLAEGTLLASSDIRIKEDIQDINDDSALNMILAIEPKTYKYIDKVLKGDKKVYGFIAQQIREVIPEAISIQKSYIPNIMLLADYDNNIITLPLQPTKIIIKENDKIKCYDKDNKEINVEVDEIIDDVTFRIKTLETPYTDNKIFVSGTEIDDFHTVDKSYIFTLNVCATQELHRKILSQEERIKELETKLEKLINYIYQ
jgi:hypothetical protein